MNIGELIRGFKLKAVRSLVMKERIGKTDLGILKVAFMVAALDGDVTDAEYEAFDAMAKKCRGCTPESEADALKEAMRAAGYLMLLSRRVKTSVLVREFVAEAKKALPSGFAYYTIEDIRRAVVTWIAVGMSDGDYSPRERACIKALRKEFAEIVIRRGDEERERWEALSPTFRMVHGASSKTTLIDKDFVSRVEKLAAQYGDTAAAARELRKLASAKDGQTA